MISLPSRPPPERFQDCFCPPISCLLSKVRLAIQKIFGYLLRIIVYQLGERKVLGAPSIMRAYQRLTSDPKEEKPFDPQRLARSKEFLLRCGGVESILYPADGGAEIRSMGFKSADFFKHFVEEFDAKRAKISLQDPRTGKTEQRAVLIPHQECSQFYEEMGKFYLPLIDIQTPEGIVKGALLPESPILTPAQKAPCIFHSHSPGRSMCMDRRFLGLHLAAGYDVFIWDPRGTADSKGIPSEGGYYLDADAVFHHILQQGYEPSRIYLSGFCEGAAVAAHLKNKYHQLGVHFIAGNPFPSMKSVVDKKGWFARLVGPQALPALQSKDPAILALVDQDCFNTEGKFKALPQSEGRFILIHTDTDRTMPHDSVARIKQAIGKAGPVTEILRRHPNKKIDGHRQPPYEDPRVWRKYVRVVV